MAISSDVFAFRGEGAVIPWASISREQDAAGRGRGDPEQLRARKRAIADRPADVQLRWMVAPTLGMPNQPFQVFRRQPGRIPLAEIPVRSGRRLTLDRVAAVIEVDVTAPAGSTVTLSASRVGARADDADDRPIRVEEMVGAASRVAPSSGSLRLQIRCSGATVIEVSPGRMTRVAVGLLEDVVALPDWELIEVVGLPFDVGTYDAGEQGLVTALTDPETAAIQRLERGSPPIGWFPATEDATIAPDWSAPDPAELVKEVTLGLREEIKPIFDGRPAHTAARFATTRRATPDGSTLETVATIRPFHSLTLPPSAEAPLALALGFGTAYAAQDGDVEAGATDDYLILATYDDEIPDSGGSNEIAAFIPTPALHHRLTAPQLLETRSAGLRAPEAPDGPWADDAQVSWAESPASAALERPSGAAFARTELGATRADSLLPPRDAGGPRTLLPTTSPAAEGPPPDDTVPRIREGRVGLVDGALTISATTGARSVSYSVALVDLYGVWSPWEDRDHVALAPAPPAPGIVDVSMVAQYDGHPAACPTVTTFDLTVDWETRVPSAVQLLPVLFPTARTGDAPGARPPAAAPASTIPIPLTLQFLGDELQPPASPPAGFSVTIEHVDEEGEQVVLPGADQGEKRRRYRIVLTHTLDYSGTRWWGVEIWARTHLALGMTSIWVPTVPAGDPRPPSAYAMTARAASPVPPSPPLVTQGPSVPLASTPDAQGHSHASIPVTVHGPNPRTVSIWEVSEAALRTAAGLAQRAEETATPSERLVQLRAVYDGLSATRRRAVFRRALTVDATTGVADVVLPRGSTDIHLFGLTATTAEGVESEWPQGGGAIAPHQYLHAVMAPRLVAPAVPAVRATPVAAGLAVELRCLSRIPVARFEVFATRSSAASRVASSMGPPVIAPIATLDAAWTPEIPAEQGMQRYTAVAVAPLADSWTPWFVRAVAVPVDAVGVLALRGMRSPDSPVVPVDLRPSDGPFVAPVLGRSVRTDLVAFQSGTDALATTIDEGAFTIRVRVDSGAESQTTTAVPLGDVAAVVDVTAQPSAIPLASQPPLVLRGPRVGGMTPLAVWWQRPSADDAVQARISVTDPIGRSTHGIGTAPAVPDDPAFGLTLVDGPTIEPRGVGLTLSTKAPRTPEWSLTITVKPRAPLRGIRPRPVTWSSALSAIPTERTPVGRGVIQVRRIAGDLRLPRRDKGAYAVFIRMKPPFTLVARLTGPSGAAGAVSVDVGDRLVIGPR
ncbi:hypothetical protein [Agrococcus sp. ProA11]|uniref:hypothetical protein n=1 Tax=Agrococcus chionoecetis TaxID=3153752 RepID=UPI003260A95F